MDVSSQIAACAGLDSPDSFDRTRALMKEKFCVLLRVMSLVMTARPNCGEFLTQTVYESGFARPHRPGDAHGKCSGPNLISHNTHARFQMSICQARLNRAQALAAATMRTSICANGETSRASAMKSSRASYQKNSVSPKMEKNRIVRSQIKGRRSSPSALGCANTGGTSARSRAGLERFPISNGGMTVFRTRGGHCLSEQAGSVTLVRRFSKSHTYCAMPVLSVFVSVLPLLSKA
jgi:hypothetical protein